MALGRSLFVLVTLLNIVKFVDFICANNRNERCFDYNCRNLAVNKVNLGLSRPDGKGFMWRYSRDSKLDTMLNWNWEGFSQLPSGKASTIIYFSLLLISGDILSNPGSFKVDMFKDFREQMKGPDIKLCHINVRGPLSKLTEVTLLVQESKLDILVVTGSHLDKSISDDTIKIEGVAVQRYDSDKNGGGLIYYDFYDKLKDILDEIWIKRKNIVLLGNFMSDLLFRGKLPEQIYYGKHLLKVINQFSLQNIIKTSARIEDNTETVIDLIIVSNADKILRPGTIEPAISDHKLVHAVINLRLSNPCSTIKTVHDYKSLNCEELNRTFEQAPWWIANIFDEVEETVHTFELLYRDGINEHVKTRTAKVRTNSLPWVTRNIRKLMNKRYKTLLKWQKNKQDLQLKMAYEKLRNEVTG